MSLGYAEKLSFIEDVGKVGMSEIFDPPQVLQEKIERLALMIQKVPEYQLLVVYLIFEVPRVFGRFSVKAKHYLEHHFHFIVQCQV